MHHQLKPLFANIGAIGIMVGIFFVLAHPQLVGFEPPVTDNQEAMAASDGAGASAASAIQEAQAGSAVATTTPRKDAVKSAPVTQDGQPAQEPSMPENATTTDSLMAARIENPYSFPPHSFDAVNNQTRLALVNILCAARNGSLRPMSASGVIIDPRGVILTNAHVAQYVLLSADPAVDLSCVIRTGSPAYPVWNAETLFIPPTWVEEHAADITRARPLGTGEQDYALLRITERVNGSALPAEFPYIPMDTREAIAFTNDSVLVASYPAEFLGGIVTQMNLYPASSVTTIKKLLTFDNETVDIISLGGIIEAQSGSSGGAVVNAWGRLVGLISTTSDGATTEVRDLHAITLNYINEDISSESGLDLASILGGDVASEAYAFNVSEAPRLRKILIDQLTRGAR